MAKRTPEVEKRPGFFKQIASLFRFTYDEFTWMPWLQGAFVLLGIGLGLVVAYLQPPVQWWTLALWGFTGALVGLLGALFLMTRLSTTVMYRKLDGMPGAAGHILSTNLGRKWQSSEMPIGINPKTQEAVYRAIGRGGIVLVGEGARGRLTRLMNEARVKAERVAHGVPITVFYVGDGEDDVHISKLSKSIKKLPKSINKATMAAVIRRIESVSQSLASLPIPKGIDPTKMRAGRPR